MEKGFIEDGKKALKEKEDLFTAMENVGWSEVEA